MDSNTADARLKLAISVNGMRASNDKSPMKSLVYNSIAGNASGNAVIIPATTPSGDNNAIAISDPNAAALPSTDPAQ